MADADSIRYFILIEFYDYTPGRLARVVPRLQKAIARMSKDDWILAYRTSNGEVAAYLLRSKLLPAQIRMRLTEPKNKTRIVFYDDTTEDDIAVLADKEKVLIIEVGDEFDTKKFPNKVEPWLAHH